MIFIQEEFLSSFESDFYDKNKSALTGAVTLNATSADKNAVNYGYYTLLTEYDKLKDAVTHKQITDYCKQ